jgi:hypothetical protein
LSSRSTRAGLIAFACAHASVIYMNKVRLAEASARRVVTLQEETG